MEASYHSLSILTTGKASTASALDAGRPMPSVKLLNKVMMEGRCLRVDKAQVMARDRGTAHQPRPWDRKGPAP